MGEEIVECKGTTWKPEVSPLETPTACYGRNPGLLHWLEADFRVPKARGLTELQTRSLGSSQMSPFERSMSPDGYQARLHVVLRRQFAGCRRTPGCRQSWLTSVERRGPVSPGPPLRKNWVVDAQGKAAGSGDPHCARIARYSSRLALGSVPSIVTSARW